MGGIVRKAFHLFSCVSLAVLALPTLTFAQSGGWGEPIAAPATPEPPPPPPQPEPAPRAEPAEPGRAEPNPEWADAPPTEYEERSPTNPDWVEESEAPPIGTQKRNASEFYDLRYANRSLTMPRGMMRGTFDTVLGRRPDDGQPFGATGTISTMNFGVGITLADDFEIGFSRYRTGSFPGVSVFPNFGFGGEGLITFSMSPQAKFGDIPFYARFEAFESDVVKLGIDAVFRIPSRTEFGFLAGIPLRFIIHEQFAFDTGAEFVVDNNPQGPSIWSLNIPFNFVANATERFFLKLNSGMNMFDLGHTVRTATSGLIQGPFYFIPLGLGAGYTADAGSAMMDIFASFRFPTFYGFTTRQSDLDAETWQVTIGLNIYSPVLFKGSAL
ncbi:MAG: hypothetical protein JRG67_07090 [Deltaproteobacteria bacterium]|nr:hypothetical protein [Deltaproteobacteria bacterium]MBW2378285.1 hypothetical protein [Deltaproteobacteria bacterium]MBW2549647.1 hypothetical protein [Deltaproteobacteria bacterium]MBW2627358.1 hypothetical protein [Deltaproteobacteria bacterium]MBW2684947.1 hypothetical protein [Deltaproteobacteria bacterium]